MHVQTDVLFVCFCCVCLLFVLLLGVIMTISYFHPGVCSILHLVVKTCLFCA